MIFLLIMLVGIAPAGFAYTSGDTYVNALKNVSSKCQKMVILNAFNELIMRIKLGTSATDDDYMNLIATDNDHIAACVAAARENGETIYKIYIVNEKNKRLKADAKSIFIAWLPYLSAISNRSTLGNNSGNNPAVAAYNKAVSTMQVDEISQ
jgi:hypothetical protein